MWLAETQTQNHAFQFNGFCVLSCGLSLHFSNHTNLCLSARELAANRCRVHLDTKNRTQKPSHLGYLKSHLEQNFKHVKQLSFLLPNWTMILIIWWFEGSRLLKVWQLQQPGNKSSAKVTRNHNYLQFASVHHILGGLKFSNDKMQI